MNTRLPACAAVALSVIAGVLALGSSARAATGTLDTGALAPQTSSSRVVQEVQNSGAADRRGHEVKAVPESDAAKVPRTAGHVAKGAAGMPRPGG